MANSLLRALSKAGCAGVAIVVIPAVVLFAIGYSLASYQLLDVWLNEHHCVATGQIKSESLLAWQEPQWPRFAKSAPDTITYHEYLCDDRDEPHWIQKGS